jgi:signal transduction histidine kinase
VSEPAAKNGSSKYAAFHSGNHIELDPEIAAGLKTQRDRRLHTVQIPLLRLVGFSFFALGVGLHNWLILGEVSWPVVIRFAIVLLVYSLLARVLLRCLYARTGRFHLGNFFLTLDIVFLVIAIYLSGGERSWIFFILLMRVADQATGGIRRALAFTHISVVGYVLMLAWIVVVDGRPLPVPVTLAKILFLYLAALYISLCALPVERRRRSTAAAVRTARALITKLQAATAQLETARLQAEEANEAKSQFLNNMNHEVRTPLNVVLGMARLLEDSGLNATQREHLGYLQESANETLSLLSDLIDLAALDEGRLQLERTVFSPAAVLRGIAEQYRPQAEVKGLEVDVTVDFSVPERVGGDSRRTRHLLRLLVDNAVKFTNKGGISMSCELVKKEQNRARLRWTVRDTGIGFRIEELTQLTDVFTQADASTTREYQGAGIGLALASRLAKAMGGALEADSSPGVGSTFWFEIPVESAQRCSG